MTFARRALLAFLAAVAACLLGAPQVLALSAHPARVEPHAAGAGTTYLSQASYAVDEDAGRFPITIDRTTSLANPEVIYYGVNVAGPEAGTNFDVIPNTRAAIPAGQSSYTFYVTIHDQGINGPARKARAYIYGPSLGTVGAPSEAVLDLLQNDPLAASDPQNPLGYPQAPSDGDPLQYVRWYVFGAQSPAGLAATKLKASKPSWSRLLEKLAFTPGYANYRPWMWNQPTAVVAGTVERYLADAERAQPGTTVAMSTYSLVHGYCENPDAIKQRYEAWIKQLADGIGNFRVVLYLEEDSLIETHCLNRQQLATRLQELAYAVKTLSVDPHLLIYMDAGAPDAYLTAKQTAKYLRAADIAQATGFFVNATHEDWTTTDIHFGQEIAKLTGGKHFIVQTGENGRGPLAPANRERDGNEVLCNPPGRGTGPLTWHTGYRYVDGLLWFNNVGDSDGTCGVGDPPTPDFFPAFAIGLIEHADPRVSGPRFNLLKSGTNM